MTAQEFLRWMDRARSKFASDVAAKLGISRDSAEAMVAAARSGREVEVKRTVALAMAAIAAGLDPWPHGGK